MPIPQSLLVAKATPFAEQLDFFRQKLALPSERYDDIVRAAHDRAFIVAGATNADLVSDLRGAIERSIKDGRGLEAFRKEFNDIVLKHGWVGWTGEGSAGGFAWRTRIIYETNMSTSYAAGRYAQLKDPALLAIRPYWKYIHADGVAHPRPLHVAWHGLVLRHDDPFWDTHYPPNGWMCHCRIMAVDKWEYEQAVAAGRGSAPAGWQDISAKTGAPVGIDKGFDYAPGASTMRPLKDMIDQKLINLDAPVGAAMYSTLQPVLQAEQTAAYQEFLGGVLADPVKRGRQAVVGAMDQATLTWLDVNKAIRPATAEIAVQDGLIVGRKAIRHEAAGDALTEADWAKLPALLANPGQILFDTVNGKLLYLEASSDLNVAKLAVEFDYKQKKTKGMVNLIVSAFRLPRADILGAIAGGLYEVLK